MTKRDQARGFARARQIELRHIDERAIGMAGPFERTIDPLKIVDGLPKKRIVPHDAPGGLPGRGRYGAAY